MKRILTLLLTLLLPLNGLCEETRAGSLRAMFLRGAEEVVITPDSVIFTDAASDTPIELPRGVGHVVSLYTSVTTLWYETGGRVSGCIGSESAAELYIESIGRDITQDEDVAVLATAAMAKKWDVERIIAAKPECILCTTAMNGYATLQAPARAAGIPLIAVDYDDFGDYLKWFRVFSALNNREDLWESVALPVLDQVVSLLTAADGALSPRVLCLFSDATGLQANTAATVVGQMLHQLQAVNIIDPEATGAADRIPVNLEAIWAADPDVIVVQCHRDMASARQMVEDSIGSSPVWQSLRAVREGRVFYLDKALFHNKPNRRFGEAYAVLATLLYGAE